MIETDSPPPILQAIEAGDLNALRRALDAGAHPNQEIWIRRGSQLAEVAIPLVTAARRGRADLVALLLERGADPNLGMEAVGATPLTCLVRDGCAEPEVVRLLIQHGADPNRSDPTTQETIVDLMAEKGQLAMLEWLVAHGARSWDGTLEAAARTGDPAVFRIVLQMLRAPPDPAVLARARGVLLHRLLEHRQRFADPLAALDEVLADDLEPPADPETGRPPLLSLCAQHGLVEHAPLPPETEIQMARRLIAAGADPTACDALGRGAAAWADALGNEPLRLFLVDAGAKDERWTEATSPPRDHSRSLSSSHSSSTQDELDRLYLYFAAGALCLIALLVLFMWFIS